MCDCTDAQATVLMTDNCLNELFVRNTVIPVGRKADPAAAGGVIALWLTSGRSSLQESGSWNKEECRVLFHFCGNRDLTQFPPPG